MTILAQKTGFLIEKIVFDSDLFQFAASEMYEKNIPLHDPISRKLNSFEQYFSEKELEDFERRAAELNAGGTGDQAIFYLKKAR